jgi:hypothetical protein
LDSPRSTSRVAVAAVLGVLVLTTLGVALWAAFVREIPTRDPREPGKVGHGVDFSLEISRVGVRTVADKLSRARVDAAAEAVRTTVEDLYLGGFVDPERWGGGEFPDAFRGFDADALAVARKDLNALTLGAAAGRLEWVDPTRGRTSIVFLLDGRNQPVHAVAGVVFQATGHLRDGGTVAITNGADLFLRPVDGEWRVYSYTASTTIKPEPSEPSSPSPAEPSPS